MVVSPVMKKRFRQLSSVVMLVVYAFFFASTNLFYHSHQLADSKVVHSHPFSDRFHSHSSSQVLTLEALSENICLGSDTFSAINEPLTFSAIILTVCQSLCELSVRMTSNCLRAPPVL